MRGRIFSLTMLACSLALLASVVVAQENASQTIDASARASQQNETGNQSSRSSADETFDLNIAERRITRTDYAASTSVEAGEESARGLRLRVGVEIGAGRIDVLLRNVRGSVRFRATLDRVLERLNARHTPEAGP